MQVDSHKFINTFIRYLTKWEQDSFVECFGLIDGLFQCLKEREIEFLILSNILSNPWEQDKTVEALCFIMWQIRSKYSGSLVHWSSCPILRFSQIKHILPTFQWGDTFESFRQFTSRVFTEKLPNTANKYRHYSAVKLHMDSENKQGKRCVPFV